MPNNEDEFSFQDRICMERAHKDRDKLENSVKRGEITLKEFIKEMLKADPKARRKLMEEFYTADQDSKDGYNDEARRRARIKESGLNQGRDKSITGYEDRPWERD